MRSLFRLAFTGSCLICAASLSPLGAAFAQVKQPPAPSQAVQNQTAPVPNQQVAPAQPPAFKQIALTDKQIDGVIAAQKEMETVSENMSDNAAPDQKTVSQLDDVAKKHGFAGYDDYSNVVDNISLVLGGFDPLTKKYVGSEAVIKAQIAQVEADKEMAEKDKKDALGELNEELKSPPPALAHTANIDLVTRYYDKLMDAFEGDQN